jgi:hypothetical protein
LPKRQKQDIKNSNMKATSDKVIESLFPFSDEEIIEFKNQCLHSIEERTEVYNRLRDLLFDNQEKNLIFKTLKDVISLIYLPDNVIFDIVVHPSAEGLVTEQIQSLFDKLQREINEDFISDSLDIEVYEWVFWSCVYGSYFVKTIYDGSDFRFVGVSPYDFGVLYEDNDSLNKEQVFCHIARIPKWLAQKKFPGTSFKTTPPPVRQDRFLELVISQNETGFRAQPKETMFDRTRSAPVSFSAKQVGEYAELYELWIYDHDRKDWFMAQIVGDRVIKSANPFIRGYHPFVKFTPNSVEGYFWGMSELHYLVNLSQTLKSKINTLEHLEGLLSQPPLIVYGVQGQIEAEEMQAKLNKKGSIIPIIDPTARFDFYLPKLDPAIIYNAIKFYEDSFYDISGIKGPLLGKSMPNVRSASYANILAQFASTQLKEKALKVEYFIESIMTIMAQCLINSSERFKYLLGIPFRVDVFAHTSSPITAMAYQDMLISLAEMGIIPNDVVIDMLPLPKKDKIKQQAKKLEQVAMLKAMGGSNETEKA